MLQVKVAGNFFRCATLPHSHAVTNSHGSIRLNYVDEILAAFSNRLGFNVVQQKRFLRPPEMSVSKLLPHRLEVLKIKLAHGVLVEFGFDCLAGGCAG